MANEHLKTTAQVEVCDPTVACPMKDTMTFRWNWNHWIAQGTDWNTFAQGSPAV